MYGDERDLSAMLYVIPRRAEVVVGGCALPFEGDVAPPPDRALRAAFLARAQAAGFRHGPVLRDAVGAPAGPPRGAGRARGTDHPPLRARRSRVHPRPRLGAAGGRDDHLPVSEDGRGPGA